MPQLQSRQVYKGKIWIDYKILSVINATATVWEQTGNSPASALAWDSASGGTRPIREEVGEFPDVDVNFWIFLGARLNGSFANEFCFVPTASALDVTTINARALTAQYTGGTSPANPSRFVNFITQRREGNQFNETHVQFTASLSEWMFDEMQNRNSRLSCIQFCTTNASITPSTATVCTVNSTFNLQNTPAGTTVTWAVTPASSFTPSSGTGATATFRAKTNNPGTGTLTFTMNSTCGTNTVSRTFTTNISPVRMPQTTYPGPYATIYAEVDPVPGATSYEWYLNGQFQQISSYNHEFVIDNCGDYYTSVRANRPTCGWTALSTIYYSVVCSGFFVIYPNPADDYLTVELTDSSTVSAVVSNKSPLAKQGANLRSYHPKIGNSQEDAPAFRVEVYNKDQQLVAQANSENSKVVLDTHLYAKGTYFLHIYYEGDVQQKQILIE